jgi:hypothetical protein
MKLYGKIMYGTKDVSNSSDCDAVKWDAFVLIQSVYECPARPYVIKCYSASYS